MGKDGNIGHDASTRPLEIDPSYASYAEDKQIFDLLAEMTKDLIINLPSDPLAHMIDFLKQPAVPRIFVHGPIGSGRRFLCDQIAERSNVVHLELNSIVAAAVDVETANGCAAAPFVKAGTAVPDSVLAAIVADRLVEGDCKRNGFVLRGFPVNRAQAVALQTKGVLPTHVFAFTGVTEALAVANLQGMLYHSKSQRSYHTTLFEAPADIADACELIPSPSNEATNSSLEEFRLNFSSYSATYHKVLVTLNADQPIADSFGEAWSRLCTMKQTDAPFAPRLVIAGARGSGDQAQANRLGKKYGAVVVHMQDLVQQAINAGNAVSRSISTSLKNKTPILESTLETLISQKLSTSQCQTQGWILTGYPQTKTQAQALCSAGFEPNRAFFLQVEKNVALSRLEGRRADPVSGKSYHLQFNPAPTEAVAVRLTQHPNDTAAVIAQSIEDYNDNYDDLKNSFKNAVTIDANYDDDAVTGFIDSHMVRPHLSKPAC